jgi:hypothetical protein
MIMMKRTETDPKKVIVGFDNWGNPRDRIIRGHRRGAVKEIKEKFKRWCELVDVDEFWTSKLCCCCHHETAKVLTKQSIVFSIAATMSVELLLTEITMGHQTFLCYLPRWFRRRGDQNHFSVPDNPLFRTKKHAVKTGINTTQGDEGESSVFRLLL